MIKKNEKDKYGVLGIEYAERRNSSKALKYRLWRRTYEVIHSIEKFLDFEPNSIIDLGTAEGRMLNKLGEKFPKCSCVGVEYNNELVDMARELFPTLDIRQGDVQNLKDFGKGSFDVAVATAVIEHVENPGSFVQQVARILRPGGLFIITAPDPFWERIATIVGHLEDEQHNQVPNLKKLRFLAEKSKLNVLLAQKFMLSPVGMPAEFAIEKILRSIGLSFMMANQLVVARR